jgi:hypothetical protein
MSIKDMDNNWADQDLKQERLFYWRPYIKPQPFFTDSHFPWTELSPYLKNEPYTVEDTGYRPNIVNSSDSFEFEIDNERGEVFVKIGQNFYNGKVSDMFEEKIYFTPDKLITNISVMDVYLNYGLNMAYSYLNNIYNNPISVMYPNWLLSYLEASMLVINPLYVPVNIKFGVNKITIYNLYLSSLILLKLTLIDANPNFNSLPSMKENLELDIEFESDDEFENITELKPDAELNLKLKMYTNLRPFFTDPHFSTTTLSSDLENEPYAITDTGYRPYIRIKSGHFEYEINNEEKASYVKINKNIYSNRISYLFDYQLDHTPNKLRTNISVMDVYINYGLNMTYCYLNYIYYNSISIINPDWLFGYLEASLLVIDPSYKRTKTTYSINKIKIYNLYLSSLILLKLALIDKDQPKLLSPLHKVKQNIPLDILSSIFQSKRISKKIGEITENKNCYQNPMTLEELSDFYDSSVDFRTKFLQNQFMINYYQDQELFEYNLEILGDNGPFIITDYEDVSITTGVITNYSLSVYRKAYFHRGCTKNTIDTLLIKLLTDLFALKVNENNNKMVCGWLLQLNFNIGNIVEMELQNNEELQSALRDTIKIVLEKINAGIL